MPKPVYINYITSLSALGDVELEVWDNIHQGNSTFKKQVFHDQEFMVSPLSSKHQEQLHLIRSERKLFHSLDKSTLMAIYTGRRLMKKIPNLGTDVGINIGSSRGATHSFEISYQQYLLHKQVATTTSPITTLGNVATSIAQDLGIQGPAISHSITCSSALHAFLNAFAFLQSEMLEHFIVGGTEAPLTGFTIAQMQAINLYTKHQDSFPCKSLDFTKKENTLVLGEAACLALMSIKPVKNALLVRGIGYATEKIKHSVSLSGDAECLQKSMQKALAMAKAKTVDAIVMHAPGTVKGDKSELRAIQQTFSKVPALTTNKWLLGHSFGASGAMSLQMAYFMLKNNQFISNPFYSNKDLPKELNTVMVNAVGFGGNAISVILEKMN